MLTQTYHYLKDREFHQVKKRDPQNSKGSKPLHCQEAFSFHDCLKQAPEILKPSSWWWKNLCFVPDR